MANKKPEPFRKLSEVQKKASPFERAMIGRKRRGVDWAKVDPTLIQYAAAAVVTVNATLVLSSAMGGIGVTIRVWAGDDKWVEYAGTAEELNEWLEAVGDHYASSSEDLRTVLGIGGGAEEEAVAGDE